MQLLYWNIQNLTLDKYQEHAIQTVISEAITTVAVDIIVVAEVYTRANNNRDEGQIYAGAGGPRALYLMLGMLQAISPAWRCMPPVSVGNLAYSEAVGVFYRSDQLTFLGPHVWSNKGPVPAGVINTNFGNAPLPWQLLLGPGETFTAEEYEDPWDQDPPFNGTPPPPLPAPQVRYPTANNAGFCMFPFADSRAPVRTTFQYQNAAGQARVLDLFSVHTSPANAVAATQAFGQVPAVAAVVPANTLRLMVGDFNVRTQTAAFGLAYNAFIAAGWRVGIGQNANAFLPATTPTHFDLDAPTPYLQNGEWGYLSYPYAALDNIIAFGNGAAVQGLWVVDQVAGAPLPWVSQLATLLPNYAAPPYGTNSFRSWDNFGHIAVRIGHGAANGRQGASDHLPLYLHFD